MICLYLTQGYSNDSVQNVNKSFTKTTTLEINAGIPVTLIAQHKFQGSGNLTEKYYINHKKSHDQPNAHSRSWSCGLLKTSRDFPSVRSGYLDTGQVRFSRFDGRRRFSWYRTLSLLHSRTVVYTNKVTKNKSLDNTKACIFPYSSRVSYVNRKKKEKTAGGIFGRATLRSLK